MRVTRTAAIIVLAALMLATTGCFAREAGEDVRGQGAGSAPMAAQVAPDQQGYSDAGQDGAKDAGFSEDALTLQSAAEPSAVERMIIRNGSLDLRVKDIDAAVVTLRAKTIAAGGEIANLDINAGGEVRTDASGENSGPTYASVILRVPAEKLDTLTDELALLGTVISRSESSSDVTEQAIDMEARLKNLRAEEVRLREILKQANKVSDLLEVERELARVRGDIEAMDAQLTNLQRQVAKATLAVQLSKPGPVVGPDSPWYAIREAISQGISGAIFVVQALITIVIAALPLVLLVALAVWIAIAATRRRGRRRAEAAKQADDTAPVTVDDATNETVE